MNCVCSLKRCLFVFRIFCGFRSSMWRSSFWFLYFWATNEFGLEFWNLYHKRRIQKWIKWVWFTTTSISCFSYLLFMAWLFLLDLISSCSLSTRTFLIGSEAMSRVADAIKFIAELVPRSFFSFSSLMFRLSLSSLFSQLYSMSYEKDIYFSLLLPLHLCFSWTYDI